MIKLALICMQFLVAAANSEKLCRPESVLSSSYFLTEVQIIQGSIEVYNNSMHEDFLHDM